MPQATERLISARVQEIASSGTNPRIIREKAPDFLEFVASIKARGVVIPVHVRTNPTLAEGRTLYRYELLAGERRWRAAAEAGVETIPAIDHGALDDAAAFEITFLENYQRQDLTPLEAGKAAAILLDRFNGDTKAVAAKLGRSERWVQLHAQIERGLSEEWKGAAQMEPFGDWSSAHWVLIARLPAVFQAKALKTLGGNAGWDCHSWTSDQLEGHLVSDRLPIGKAPFDTAGCGKCLNRTGVQPMLWGDSPEELSGENDRCLDRACWQRREVKAAKAAFAETTREKGVPEAVPISTVERKDGYDPDYNEKVKAAKKAFGPQLVTADRVRVCKKGDKGAVPAIVVAGRGKGGVKWVRISEARKDDGPGERKPTAAELAKQKAADEIRERQKKIIAETFAAIAKADKPGIPAAVYYCCYVVSCWPIHYPAYHYYERTTPKLLVKAVAAWARGPKAFIDHLTDLCWTRFVGYAKDSVRWCNAVEHWPEVLALGPLFGLDPAKALADLMEREPQAASPDPQTQAAPRRKRGRPRKKAQP